jgi:hypothetical protein
MPQSPDSLGPIRSHDAVRVCHLTGIAAAEQKLTTLRQLKHGLDLAIADLDRQKRAEQIGNKGLLVARFTRLACDTFVELAAEMATVVLPEAVAKQAEMIAKSSKLGGQMAEAASTVATGGRLDGKTLIDIGKSASKFVKADDATKLIIKSATVKVEVVHRAMNQDSKGVLKKALDYAYDLHVKLGELAGHKKAAAFAKIAKQAFDYNESLGKIFDEAVDADYETVRRHQSLKTSLVTQARRISRKIEEVEAFVASCEPAPEMRLP